MGIIRAIRSGLHACSSISSQRAYKRCLNVVCPGALVSALPQRSGEGSFWWMSRSTHKPVLSEKNVASVESPSLEPVNAALCNAMQRSTPTTAAGSGWHPAAAAATGSSSQLVVHGDLGAEGLVQAAMKIVAIQERAYRLVIVRFRNRRDDLGIVRLYVPRSVSDGHRTAGRVSQCALVNAAGSGSDSSLAISMRVAWLH
jgi:hypothetical protein